MVMMSMKILPQLFRHTPTTLPSANVTKKTAPSKTPDRDYKRRNCENCNRGGHDWYMCTQKGGALEHLSYSDRTQYFDNCAARRRDGGWSQRSAKKPYKKGGGKRSKNNRRGARGKGRDTQSLETKFNHLTAKFAQLEKASKSGDTFSMGGEEEDNESGDEEECHMAKRARTFSSGTGIEATPIAILPPVPTATTIIDNQGATDIDIDTSAALSVGGASSTGGSDFPDQGSAPTTTAPSAFITTTINDEGATDINGHDARRNGHPNGFISWRCA
jgi:hypothetical protein